MISEKSFYFKKVESASFDINMIRDISKNVIYWEPYQSIPKSEIGFEILTELNSVPIESIWKILYIQDMLNLIQKTSEPLNDKISEISSLINSLFERNHKNEERSVLDNDEWNEDFKTSYDIYSDIIESELNHKKYLDSIKDLSEKQINFILETQKEISQKDVKKDEIQNKKNKKNLLKSKEEEKSLLSENQIDKNETVDIKTDLNEIEKIESILIEKLKKIPQLESWNQKFNELLNYFKFIKGILIKEREFRINSAMISFEETKKEAFNKQYQRRLDSLSDCAINGNLFHKLIEGFKIPVQGKYEEDSDGNINFFIKWIGRADIEYFFQNRKINKKEVSIIGDKILTFSFFHPYSNPSNIYFDIFILKSGKLLLLEIIKKDDFEPLCYFTHPMSGEEVIECILRKKLESNYDKVFFYFEDSNRTQKKMKDYLKQLKLNQLEEGLRIVLTEEGVQLSGVDIIE
ncbi:hypothetical protein JXR93_02530 [bacterium]|nr:hypothetical protein [bacterium]